MTEKFVIPNNPDDLSKVASGKKSGKIGEGYAQTFVPEEDPKDEILGYEFLEVGIMEDADIIAKLNSLNKNISGDDNKWRLATQEELCEILKISQTSLQFDDPLKDYNIAQSKGSNRSNNHRKGGLTTIFVK